MHLSQFGVWVEPDSGKLFCLKPSRRGNREQTAAAAGRGKAAATFFYWLSCNFGRDFRQNQFSCHQHCVQTIFKKELLHPSTTNIIQIQSISPSTRHRIEAFIVQVNNHLQNALSLKKNYSDPGPKPLYWYCTSDPWRSVLVTCHLGLKVYSFHFWSLLKWSHCTSPHLQACVSLLIILEAPWKRSLEGFIDSPTANSTKVIKYFAINVLIEASNMSKKSCYNTLWRWTRGDKKGGVNVLAEYCYPWNILAT